MVLILASCCYLNNSTVEISRSSRAHTTKDTNGLHKNLLFFSTKESCRFPSSICSSLFFLLALWMSIAAKDACLKQKYMVFFSIEQKKKGKKGIWPNDMKKCLIKLDGRFFASCKKTLALRFEK